MATGTSRQIIRRRVLARFGDLLIVTATAGGSTTTLKDTTRLVGEPSRFRARQAFFTGGTTANLGLVRYVDASSRDTNTITFSQALPAATATGDEAELSNTHGIGVTNDAVHDAINDAIGLAQRVALVPLTAAITDPFDGEEARTIAIPDTFVGIDKVQYQDANTNAWINVRRAPSFGQVGWSVDHANRLVTVSGYPASVLNEQTVRLYGYGTPEPLDDDADLWAGDLDWLLLKTSALIALDLLSRNDASNRWAQRGLLWDQQADDRFTRLTPNLGPSFVRVR